VSKKIKPALKVLLVGSNGRMGQQIAALAGESGCDIAASVGGRGDWGKLKAKSIDVIIDFSTPEGMIQALDWAVKNDVPFVSGSTGLKEKDHAALQKAAKKIPVLYSGNMSMGIAVLSAMMKQLSAIRDWDFQIEEVHHNQKKDKPSGTALLLQKSLTKAVGKQIPEAQAIRGGGVPGIHTVWVMGKEEVLTLQHTAFNRQVFARGALRAAGWLFDKGQPGLYDLSDLYTVD
jgi:4-hydroxy-tetrahydrodipicolinate reductase